MTERPERDADQDPGPVQDSDAERVTGEEAENPPPDVPPEPDDGR